MVDFASGADGDLAAVCAALQRQCQEQFALAPPFGHGLTASIRLAASDKDVAPEEWLLGLYLHPDQPGALGYHDRTEAGMPVMKIFPALDMQDNVPWSTTASHEVLETLLDPELCRAAQSPSGHFWALECGDFVENDTYEIDNIAVSNFSLPAAFEPPSNLASVKYDWMGLSTGPFQIRPGGYGQYWDGRKWVQVTKTLRNARLALNQRGHSRHARRVASHAHPHDRCGDPHYT
jgi:hypothetical protein